MSFGRRKVMVVAASAIGAAGLAAGAVAATSGSSDDAGDLAAAINKRAGTSITADQLTGAYQDVLKAHLAEAVTAGKITQEQADQMLARAQNAPGIPLLRGPGDRGHRGPGDRGHRGPRADVLAPVAKKLGLTEAQIRTKLEAGSTLAKIAKAEGVSRADLLATITGALKADSVPAARVGDLAAHIADHTRPEPGERHRGPRGPRP